MNHSTRTAVIIGGIALAILVGVPLIWGGLSEWQGGAWGMMGPGMMGGFGMGFGAIFMVAFWVLVIWAVVALADGIGQPRGFDSHYSHPDSALEVLKRRYARGEIGKEEYEEKKGDLV